MSSLISFVPGGGASFVHLSTLVPAIKHKLDDADECLGVDIIQKIDENLAREIINHRSLRHPNIIRFKEVLLTPTHLAIVMEYAAGGELFERICNAGRFSEGKARYFFQQLIPGVYYCHFMAPAKGATANEKASEELNSDKNFND